MGTHSLAAWRQRVRAMRADIDALALAMIDPRVPWYAKAIAGLTVAYAFCPLDLIPDWIPVLGLLDDLVLVPLGIALAARLIPPAVMTECRARATARATRPNWWAAAAIIALWLLLVAWLSLVIWRRLR